MRELLKAVRECLPDLRHYVSTHGPGPDKRLEKLLSVLEKMRTIIAISENYWGRGDTVEEAMRQLKKAGGTTRRGKMLLQSAPYGAYISDDGGTCYKMNADDTNDGETERPYYIDRDGNRLVDQTKPLV